MQIITAQKKSDFRAQAKARLIGHKKSFSKAHLKVLKELILSIAKGLKVKRAINILGYSAFGFEMDINPLLLELRKNARFRIYLPKMICTSKMCSKSEPFMILPYSLPLVKNPLKIKEPLGAKRDVRIDIAIVPCIGVDSTLARIGYGYGSYDKTLMGSRAVTIFTAPLIVMCKDKIADDFDIVASFVMSREILLKRMRKNIKALNVRLCNSNFKLRCGYSLYKRANLSPIT